MKRSLEQYQLEALSYLDARRDSGKEGGSLFMDMRLGKSWPSDEWIERNGLWDKALILCPAKVLPAWLYELSFHPNQKKFMFVGTKSRKTEYRDRLANGEWKGTVVASYASAVNYDLLSLSPKAIILDESYILANAGNIASRYIWDTPRPHGQFRIGLSGSPFAEDISQLVSQYICIDGHLGPYTKPWDYFEKNSYTDRFGKLTLYRGQAEMLEEYMKANSFCRTRAQVGVGGGKNYQRIWCDLPENLRVMHNEIASNTTINSRDRFSKLWMLCSGISAGEEGEVESFHRHQALCEWLSRKDAPKKVVIFCKFLSEIRTLKEWLLRLHPNVLSMNGSVTYDKQLENEDLFRNWDSGYAVLQEDAFKMGLDFSSSDTLIYFSNSTSGDARNQSEDRIIHRNKKHDVDIIDLCCRQAACSYVADMVRDKTITAREVLSRGMNYIGVIEKWQEK